MGDDGLRNLKAFMVIAAGVGASYGIYQLVSGRGYTIKHNTSTVNEVHENDPEIKTSGKIILKPGSLLAKVSAMNVNRAVDTDAPSSYSCSKSPGNLEPQHLEMLLSLLQNNPNSCEINHILLTLGNSAAFTVNQDLLREIGGLHIIASFLYDPVPEVRVHTLNVLNNLSMNIRNQEQLQVYIPQVLELIEMSPVNSDLQLAALRLLTNLSVTNKHQHLMRSSLTLLLSLLIVSNEALQLQVLKILVNLSSNPCMVEDIIQAQAPASLVLMFDQRTPAALLLRLLVFLGNLKAWRPSSLVADPFCHRNNSLYHVLLDRSSQLHNRLPLLLSHPDQEVRAQATLTLTARPP